MKTVLYYFATVSALLMLSGCIQEQNTEDNPFGVTFNVSLEDATKTSYETGGKVNWVEGDIIRYYTLKDGPVNEYEVVRSGHSIQMVANVPDDAQVIIAQYGGTGLSNKSVKGFTLDGVVKAEQSGKFEDAHVSVAKSFDLTNGASLTFRNITSLIKFSFTRADVAYIVFTANGGEKIHGDGRLNISFSDTEPSASFYDAGGSSIRVNVGGAGTFFLSTLPVKLSRGFVIEYFDTADQSLGKTMVDSPVTSIRNHVLSLGTLDERIAEPAPEPEAIDLGLPSGLKWASFNVGATKVGDYGNHFSWGETVPTNLPSWSTYRWCNGSSSTITKYNTVDNKTVLDLEDDAAHINWGGSWRMPTDAEWKELYDNCTWTWTIDYNGTGIVGIVGTSKINGYTDKSIFLPAAGHRNEMNHLYYKEGTRCFYWSSSRDINYHNEAIYYSSDKYGGFFGSSTRILAKSIRPVYGVFIPVSSIVIDKSEVSLVVDETYLLSATLFPTNATAPEVRWVSSDESIVTVSQDGKVTAVSQGSATITASASNGMSVSCSIDVQPAPEPEAIDLGLPSGLKWASFNVGASAPGVYGDYFAWGETEPKSDYSWSTYKFELGTNEKGPFSKYVTKSSYGTVDNKTVLDLADDAAHVNWGGSWRMPTDAEWKELRNNCTWTWTTYNGVNGRKVTGPNGNTIFLPAAGYRDNSYLTLVNYGLYWSSSLANVNSGSDFAGGFSFDSDVFSSSSTYRYRGRSVRPVYAENTPVETTPFRAEWAFSADAMAAYKDNFGGTAGVKDKNAGDGGCFVNSNVTPGGNITYVQIDKTNLDPDNNAMRIVGSTGHPYVKGPWIGDYWLFTLSNGKEQPAGTKAHIKYITRVSKTGPKYWIAEYYDGEEWKPAFATYTHADGFDYNLVMEADGITNITVEAEFPLAKAVTDIQFRMRCVSMLKANGGEAIEKCNGGTSRIAGAAADKYNGTENTSPIFEVVALD